MFNKLKQVKDLRDQAKTMQNALSGEKVEAEKGGVKVVMNGNLEVQSIEINSELSKESLENTVKDCVNDCMKKAQKLMASKMREMGGLPGLM